MREFIYSILAVKADIQFILLPFHFSKGHIKMMFQTTVHSIVLLFISPSFHTIVIIESRKLVIHE